MPKYSKEIKNSQALYKETNFYKKNLPTDNLGLLSITYGLTDNQIDQLIHYANTDKIIGEYSSDPRRFKDREAYNNWLKKGRSIYSMIDNEKKLLGIVWFGKSNFPSIELKPEFSNLDINQYGITFALRIYKEARGKRIAKKLTAAAFTAYLTSKDYQAVDGNGIWLETSKKNIAAVKTYNSLFTQISNPDENGKIVMVLNPQS